MNRKDIILGQVDKLGKGLEIGPNASPLAPKRDGYQVHVMDHLSREELLVKYKDHEVALDQIEEVDYVWKGESFEALIGKNKEFDWIVASHVIEHTPDLIGFLNECDSILKENGILSLAIPDKRYCFDHFRSLTPISKLIDSHLASAKAHSPGSVTEYYLNVVSRDGRIAWEKDSTGNFKFVHSPKIAKEGLSKAIDGKELFDIHAWCFVPHSFRLLVKDLNEIGLVSLQEIDFHPTLGHEFFISLGRKGKGCDIPRIELLNTVDQEIAEGIDNPT